MRTQWSQQCHNHTAPCSVGLLLPGQSVVVLDTVDRCQAKPMVVQISLELDTHCREIARFRETNPRVMCFITSLFVDLHSTYMYLE